MTSLATARLYRTESGSVYEVRGSEIRRHGGRSSTLSDWTPFVSLTRLPAAAARVEGDGEILEIRLATGRRVFTSRLVPLVGGP